jgi:hypothetical protein
MNYTFYILTTSGIKTGTVDSDINFSAAPFGVVPYRLNGSCELNEETVTKFWDVIDLVLTQNHISSTEFIRAIRAVQPDGTIYGEVFPPQ